MKKNRKKVARIYCSMALSPSRDVLVVVDGPGVKRLDKPIRDMIAYSDGRLIFSTIRTQSAGYSVKFKSHKRMLAFANAVVGDIVSL